MKKSGTPGCGASPVAGGCAGVMGPAPRSAGGAAQHVARALVGGPLCAGARGIQLGELRLQVARLLVGRGCASVPDTLAVEVPGALVIGKGAFECVEQLALEIL